MTVTPLTTNGNSAKFAVQAKHGDFVIALSFTLRTKVWQLQDADHELAVATELAEAIVSRHDMSQPFKPLYIFAEHNTPATAEEEIKQIRKHGYQ